MTIDLGRALRDAVDGGPQGAGPWDGADRLARLTSRVRRRRAARVVTTSAVGLGAACAVSAAAVSWSSPDQRDAPPVAGSPSPENGDPVPPADPVPWSASALCGAVISPTSGAVTVSLGAPGVEPDLELVGRSIGPVPVWLDVQADAAVDRASSALDDAQVVVVSGGRVVAVADDAATVVSSDAGLLAMLRARQQETPGGSGDLESCPAAPGATAGLAGHVPPAGDYTLHGVVDLIGADSVASERFVSAGVPLTLLPEQPPLPAGTPGIPEGYPVDVVPVVGGTVTDSDHFTSNRESWKVVVEVEGDDALSRAVSALGSTGTGLWDQLTGTGSSAPRAADDAITAEAVWWRNGGADLLGTRYTEGSVGPDNVRLVGSHLIVNARVLPGPDGTTTLEYIVSRR